MIGVQEFCVDLCMSSRASKVDKLISTLHHGAFDLRMVIEYCIE